MRNYESQFYPHSLWIVLHKTVRDYDLLQFLMGRNRAILLGDGVFLGREVYLALLTVMMI